MREAVGRWEVDVEGVRRNEGEYDHNTLKEKNSHRINKIIMLKRRLHSYLGGVYHPRSM